MMHGKAIWKHGISEIAKASSRGIVPGPHKGEAYSIPYEHPAAMACGHKTQSFMKNGG